MAYREVRVMDIEHVIRRWTAGEAIRAIARATGLDRQTVRGLVRLAKTAGLKLGDRATEQQLQIIQKSIARPGAWSRISEAERCLQPHRQRIQAWLNEDRLVLTKIHELLRREGIVVSYAALYRFAREVVRLWKIVNDPCVGGKARPVKWPRWISVGWDSSRSWAVAVRACCGRSS